MLSKVSKTGLNRPVRGIPNCIGQELARFGRRKWFGSRTIRKSLESDWNSTVQLWTMCFGPVRALFGLVRVGHCSHVRGGSGVNVTFTATDTGPDTVPYHTLLACNRYGSRYRFSDPWFLGYWSRYKGSINDLFIVFAEYKI